MGAVVEALVVFNGHQQPLGVSRLRDRLRLFGGQHQRLDAEHVLVGFKRVHHSGEVQLVGQGDQDRRERRQLFEQFFIQMGLRALRGREGAERLPRKGFQNSRGAGEGGHGALVLRADGDLPEAALPLPVEERRQKLIVCDHAPADDQSWR